MINWKVIVIGVILAIILSIFFGAGGGIIGFLGMLIAGIAVGYMVDVNMKNGAIHGAITGVITGIILTVVTIILSLVISGSMGAALGLSAIAELIVSIIIFTILGAIGGVIGAIITERLWGTILTRGDNTRIASTESPKEMKPKIGFTRENISKCLCSQCPVQAESECAQTKMKMLQESMRGMSPEPSDVPGVYCATGTAACSDLDPSKMCNCPNCDVFKENNLAQREPGEYFCQKGAAK